MRHLSGGGGKICHLHGVNQVKCSSRRPLLNAVSIMKIQKRRNLRPTAVTSTLWIHHQVHSFSQVSIIIRALNGPNANKVRFNSFRCRHIRWQVRALDLLIGDSCQIWLKNNATGTFVHQNFIGCYFKCRRCTQGQQFEHQPIMV